MILIAQASFAATLSCSRLKLRLARFHSPLDRHAQRIELTGGETVLQTKGRLVLRVIGIVEQTAVQCPIKP